MFDICLNAGDKLEQLDLARGSRVIKIRNAVAWVTCELIRNKLDQLWNFSSRPIAAVAVVIVRSEANFPFLSPAGFWLLRVGEWKWIVGFGGVLAGEGAERSNEEGWIEVLYWTNTPWKIYLRLVCDLWLKTAPTGTGNVSD